MKLELCSTWRNFDYSKVEGSFSFLWPKKLWVLLPDMVSFRSILLPFLYSLLFTSCVYFGESSCNSSRYSGWKAWCILHFCFFFYYTLFPMSLWFLSIIYSKWLSYLSLSSSYYVQCLSLGSINLFLNSGLLPGSLLLIFHLANPSFTLSPDLSL